ncbi:class I SAM-dependent methyltransferase [Woodsholea maritima]|uniref:class I SAM-dependent methyltransferase n=1 Tax=Woodsholea maritima TaxID=240237 RepID=UPI0003707FB7|nr:methyltransferase [Woodsholea maritima]
MVLSVHDNPKVQNQYENWPYPTPIKTLDDFTKPGGFLLGDPSFEFFNIWPEGHERTLSILVAGCGTFQAAYTAWRNPTCQVVGIDIAKTSLAESRRLKAHHGLDNLEIKRLSLFDVASLGQAFDYILCSGVVHHLPDPVAGVRALSNALKDDGVLHLMVYGKAMRTGVYMVQSLFKAMGLGQSKKDIALAREALQHLPKGHAVERYIAISPELEDDAAFVDTFLNAQDTAFDVRDIYDLAEAADLQFQGWSDRHRYSVMSTLNPGHPLRETGLKLSPRDQAIAMDQLTQGNGRHLFWLRKKACDPKRFTPDFTSEAFWTYVPIPSPYLEIEGPIATGKAGPVLAHHLGTIHPLSLASQLFLTVADGSRSIKSCLKALSERGAQLSDESEAMTRAVFQEFYERGHIQIHMP